MLSNMLHVQVKKCVEGRPIPPVWKVKERRLNQPVNFRQNFLGEVTFYAEICVRRLSHLRTSRKNISGRKVEQRCRGVKKKECGRKWNWCVRGFKAFRMSCSKGFGYRYWVANEAIKADNSLDVLIYCICYILFL